MQLRYSVFYLSSAALTTTTALVPFPLEERTIGQSCTTPDGTGTCQNTADCTTQGFNLAGYCPGPADIQCCIKQTCNTGSSSGICMNTSDKCGGNFVPGFCPGDSTIQCCTSSSSSPPSSGSGASLVAAAVAEEGLPYVWGGGGCDGPSDGGFDCSGLTQYATCKSGHGLIPRTAQTQYDSAMGKHLARADAEAGDMIFWADGGDCVSSVAHVGIFMREGWMVNAAETGTPVREQSIWISSGGESICPDAVRFW